MRTIRSILAALALMTLLATPALAQDDDAVNVTFQLTVNGEVPADTVFVASFEYRPQGGGSSPLPYFFCGSDSPPPALTGPAKCEGNGTVYTYTADFVPSGSTIEFYFSRVQKGGTGEEFHQGTVTLNQDTTLSAAFNFPGSDDNQQGGDDQKQIPTQLPSTGAGGMAGSGIPRGRGFEPLFAHQRNTRFYLVFRRVKALRL